VFLLGLVLAGSGSSGLTGRVGGPKAQVARVADGLGVSLLDMADKVELAAFAAQRDIQLPGPVLWSGRPTSGA
jgi:hypothetical protein